MRLAAGVLILATLTQMVSPLPINLGELVIALALVPVAARGAAALWEWMA
jgi:hypothetical protein